MLLLGALLLVIAITGRVGLPERPIALVILAIVLIYWGLRAWMRRESAATRIQTHIRAGSLVLVGLLMLAVRVSPLQHANLLLGLSGCVLVIRGFLGAVLFVRTT